MYITLASRLTLLGNALKMILELILFIIIYIYGIDRISY